MSVRPSVCRNQGLSFHGTSLTRGVAHGRAYLLKRMDLDLLRKDMHQVDLVSAELAHLDFALSKSKDQISRLMNTCSVGCENLSYSIFDAELHLMNDPAFISPIRDAIEQTGLNGEYVLAQEIARLRDAIVDSSDAFAEKNMLFMQDLYSRLLYNMLPGHQDRISSLINIPVGSVLVADRLTPVEVAVVPMDRVVGILVEESALHSHASIMARTMGVPVVIDLSGIGALIDDSTDILIDGFRGNVFLNPSEAVVTECRGIERLHALEAEHDNNPEGESSVRSVDGTVMQIVCNASTLADVQRAHTQGIREIGLFRTEMRYLSKTVAPTDDQESAYYAGLFGVEGMESITIRLLDIGGDKLPVYMLMGKETDPQLGARGIRFLLSRRALMKKQLRTILSGGDSRKMKVLLPFISMVEDVVASRAVFNEVLEELHLVGIGPSFGIMVEVPAAALSIEQFLPIVDFVCLGTNDLMQYFFAVNRDQDDLQKYNRFTHPAFLKLLRGIITQCDIHKKQLTVCGEMASDPAGVCLLAAMGARRFSVQPESVHLVYTTLTKVDVGVLHGQQARILSCENADDVEYVLREFGI